MGKPQKNILLVEDDLIIARSEAQQLEKMGYSVIHAPSGEKSIELVDGNPGGFDLILMDIDLGEGIDGTEAAQLILRKNDIPLLFLSSHTEPEVVRKTEEITNYGYVVKSSSFTVLDASMKMALKLFDAHKRINRINMEFEATNEVLRVSLGQLQETNAELARSEDKFSKAFHLNPDAININRLSDGVYIDINEGFTQIMGYTREDIIGRSSFPGDLGIWVRPEDRDRLIRGLRERGEVANLESEFRKKDGTTTIGLMSARIIDIGGEQCIISITRDMGNWMRLETRLQATEERFRLAFESSPIGISLTASNGQLRMANRALCEVLGLSMMEMHATDFESLTHPEDRILSLEMERELLEGRTGKCQYRKRLIHKDGHAVWVDINIALARGEADGPEFFISHFIDISDRRKIEDELRLKSILLDNAGDSIQALDLEGTIVYVNDAVCRNTGYTKTELLGNHITILDTPEGKRRSKSLLADVARRGSARFTSLQARKDKSIFPIEVNCVLEPTEKKLVLSIVRDISEQKRGEEANKRVQAILKSTLDSHKDIYIVSIDKDFKCLYANTAYKDIKARIGLRIEPGKCLLDDVSSDIFLRDYLSHYRRALAGESLRVEEAYESIGMVIESLYTPIYSESGEIMGASSFAMDITGRKKMEEDLTNSEVKWRSIISASPDVIAEINPEGKILFVSPKALPLLGYDSIDDIVGQRIDGFVVPEHRKLAESFIRSILAGEAKRPAEFILCAKDGSRVFTEINPELIIREGRSNLLLIIRDISEWKRQDEKFKENQHRYLDLLNAIGEGFCYLDGDEIFRLANPSAERIFLAGPGSLLGKSLFDFLDEDGKSTNIREAADRKKGESSKYVAQIIRADGQRRWLQVNAAPATTNDGRFLGTSALFRDITEELKSKEELRELVKSRELLMKELEHRVKNGLGLVTSLLGIASDKISDQAAKGILADTESRIKSLSLIYEQLYLSENLETIEFGAYVEALSRSIFDTYTPDSTRVALLTQIGQAEIDTKRAISLGLIVNELLTNCIKYAFPGNRSGTITVAFSAERGQARLAISDDGIGLPEPGAPGSSTTMGMSLIRLLAEQIKGSMIVDSSAGTAISVSFQI